MWNQCLLPILLVLFMASAISAGELYPPMQPPFVDIIRDGEAHCVIVPSEDSGEAGQWAAEQVKSYLAKISGVEAPIAPAPSGQPFVIRIARDNALQEEELHIRCDGKSELLLAGGGDRGVIYAACAFLEECLGVRWFMPTDYGEVLLDVPRGTSVRVGVIDRTERPAFALRWVGKDPDWVAHNRLNVGLPVAPLKVALPGHTFEKTIPEEKYFKDHPDWFSYHRETQTRRPRQLCTTNPALIQEVIKNLRAILDADPEARVIGLCPNDGTGFCECDACMALDEPDRPTVIDINTRYVRLGEERRTALSRRFLIFFNQVAAALRESHPNVTVRCFVYNAYLAPPTDPTLRCEPNLMVQICHNTCHNHPFGSGDCPLNADFREIVEGWARICERPGFYEYYGKGASMGLPWPMVHCIRSDIPYLHSKGVWGLYTQWSESYIAPAGLNFYVAAKLLWNPQLDVDALLDDFFSRFYGPAALPMRRIFDRLEERAARSPLHAKGSSDTQYRFVLDWFAAEVLDPCFADIQEARKLTDDPMIGRRIAIKEAVLTFAKLMREYGEEVNRIAASKSPADANMDEAKRRADAVHAFVAAHKRDGLSLTKYARAYLNPGGALKRIQTPLANPW